MVVRSHCGCADFDARRMTGITGNIYAGLHEFADMAFVLHFLRGRRPVRRCGRANVGSYTILVSGVVGCRTIAFEPDPITCRPRSSATSASTGLPSKCNWAGRQTRGSLCARLRTTH